MTTVIEKIQNASDLIDIWREVGEVPIDVAKAEEFQAAASEIQIEAMKTKALNVLLDAITFSENDSDRVNAAKALLQHYRSEKLRLAARPKIKAEDVLHETELFGPWAVKKPGSSL